MALALALAQTKSFVDDANLLLPSRDFSWFLTTFAELSTPLCMCLNLTRTKILTSLTCASPIFNDNVFPDDANHPCTALATLGQNSKILQGTCFLGQPLGSQAFFSHNFLTNDAVEHTNATAWLLDHLTDTRTQCSFFKNWTQTTIPHLLASDVCCNIDLTSPSDLSSWSSTFATLRVNANHHFSCCALNAPHHCHHTPFSQHHTQHKTAAQAFGSQSPMLLQHV
jgi:hypothetical protein